MNTVSVLLSAYNGSQYIEQQLESIRNQTCAVDEVVVIDDCSTDTTVDVVDEYIEGHHLENKWRLIRNRNNKGWKRNFIEGIDLTRGDIVFFSDQDDVWALNKIETYKRLLEANDDVNVIGGFEVLWDGNLNQLPLMIKNTSFKRLRLGKSGENYSIQCSGCSMCFRRSYWNKIGNYYVNGQAHDDFFWKMSALDGSFAFLQSSSVLHRITPGVNVSRKKRTYASSIEDLKVSINICQSIEKIVNHNPDFDADTLKIIEHKEKGYQLRLKSFKTKNPFLTIYLASKYKDIFGSKKQVIGDVLLYWNLIRRGR